MSDDDDEVLLLGNDLSKHIISEGFTDFSTFNTYFTPIKSSYDTKSDSSALGLTNNAKSKSSYMSPYDESKIICLLNSKLLLPEDFEIMEFLKNETETSNSQDNSWWVCTGGIIGSTISLALLLSKRVSFLMPASILSALSFISLKHFYSCFQGNSENRTFISGLSCLQSLCLNVNKLLRLLKETEILSTGQVTTHNVGAALYIPLKNLVDHETLPSWKTLPHLRMCLANALLDIIDLLKSACAEARNIVPKWLHIEGCNLSDESFLLDPHFAESLRRTNNYISLKDLQSLNDSYLVLQSELLRWIGFCICPSAWCTSDSNYKSSRSQILKLFSSVHSQLSVISFKLSKQYDIQNIFLESEQLRNHKQMTKDHDILELNYVQSEVHRLYLLVLSMLVHLKSLEGQIEANSNRPGLIKTDLISLKETLSEQLKNVRNELASAVKMFDTICLHSFPNKKSDPVQSDKLEEKDFKNTSLHKNQLENSNSAPESHPISLDEVFLAVTDLILNEQEKEGDWDLESKPMIPNTLLSELSTTLKPIKEDFKKREKAALERLGMEDINYESDNDSDGVGSNEHANSRTDTSLCKMKNKRLARPSKSKRRCYESLSDDSEESEGDCLKGSQNGHTKVNTLFNKTVSEDIPSSSCPVINDKTIARMIAVKSQTWGLAEEEYFSDD